jgi:response regulator RpfG family c-di-GMP phosphodiesterase
MVLNKAINVLYVDEEEYNVQSFTSNFRRVFNVFTALSIFEANMVLSKHTIHVIIVEQRMSGISGIKFLMMSLNKYSNVARILLTSSCEKQDLIDAINKAEIFRYIEKPWNTDELERFITEGYSLYLKCTLSP